MPFKKKNTESFAVDTLKTSNNLSPATQRANDLVNKKLARFFSRLLFSPVFLKLNKKQFLVEYMWLFTHKKVFSLEENNTDKNNREHWASIEYLLESSKDLKTSFSKKNKKTKNKTPFKNV